MPLSPISDAIDAIRNGRMVIIVDDEDRENEGDLVVGAEHMNTELMAFMIRHTSGVVFLSITDEAAKQLDLPPMVQSNTNKYGVDFTVSIEAASGVTTGVSAADRVTTIQAAISQTAKPEDLNRPGHVFPLRAKTGGVLVRAGHTEASNDLARLAGLRPFAVGCELMNDNGTMMRLPDLKEFSREHDIPLISVEDLIAYRRKNEMLVREEAESELETATGLWTMKVFKDAIHGKEHVALIKGEINSLTPTLVRVHSECMTGDAFHSLHCDCGEQLNKAMEMIAEEGSGVVLYLRQEGRGIGLTHKVKAYKLQASGLDTVEANEELGLGTDLREYGIGAQILKEIGVGHLRLLTNNPKKVVGLEGYSLHIDEQVPLEIAPSSDRQKKYLKTKKEKLGHRLSEV